MTYVSRRARITVPRWPNDFDPEFLFRVGRRCDGRLKRHSSCHDLRAWINDNCIKNEYLLDLMSDGEVTIRPPLQLYGRFIPVPLLFKLLQNSRSEKRAENSDSHKIGPRSAKDRTLEDTNNKADALGTPYEDTENKIIALGATYGERQRPKESGVTFADKLEESRPPIIRESNKIIRPKGIHDEGTLYGKVYEQGAGVEPTSGNEPAKPVRRKWDSEKLEYTKSGFASKGALVEGVQPRPTSTESTLVIEDENENMNDTMCDIMNGTTNRNMNEYMKSINDSPKSESEGNLARVVWERNLAEKNLFKSTCLLTKAIGKLEKIDKIIQTANEEREKLRKGEIQEAFHKPRVNCIFLGRKTSGKASTPIIRYRVRSPGYMEKQETLKCSEILRQISGLREKLKKNQECQQKVNEEITMSQKESGTSPHMTELDDEGEAHLQKLEKRLEKLISHRGKLLSDMCQALTHLNNLKRSRNSRVDLRQRSKSGESRNSNYRQEQCQCGCGCRNCHSSESEKAHCSDSGSSSDNHFRRPGVNFSDEKKYYDYSSTDNVDSGQQNLSNTKTTDTLNAYTSNGEFYKDDRQEKEGRKSILRLCKRELDADVQDSEKCLRSGQHSPTRGTWANNASCRPRTSPTTMREKRDASEERQFYSYRSEDHDIPERRVKSETTMKEIEKTLRNYEQRLSDMDGLEYKVEEWRRKLLEAYRWKRDASKVEAQMKKEQVNERNKASLEINGLFSENYELKKQVRQLVDRSKEQAKKIQNMKSSIHKARELENETEELKKELTEYRNSYEHQRKCISKWESVVALQRKEIENLMNHIRKLTTEKKEQMNLYCQERKCAQRTRSCSPPITLVECPNYCTPETCNMRSDEENGSCCCQDFRQSESRRDHLRFFDKNYYSSINEREDWCN